VPRLCGARALSGSFGHASAGVVIDAVRCCKLALDNKLSGAIIKPSAYFVKSPPVQYTDEEARR
jgi:myo-inositol-1-phosphate synthase